MDERLQLVLSGVNDVKSQCGSATITFSLQDMRTHRIAANQLVQISVQDSASMDMVADLEERCGLALGETAGAPGAWIAASWPSPTLPKGIVHVSKDLHETLARPEDGSILHISLGRVVTADTPPKVFARLLMNRKTERIACLPSLSRTTAATAAKVPPAKASPAKSKAAGRHRGSQGASTSSAAEPPAANGLDLGRLAPEQLSPASLEWLLDTAANSGADADSRAVLQSLLLSHWHQRYFLPGTLVVAPLLGRRVIFELLLPDDASAAQGRPASDVASSAMPASPPAAAAFQVVADDTTLDILPPGMAVPEAAPDVPEFRPDTDPDVARALAALEKDMKEVPDSVVTAVSRAIQLGRSSRTTYADLAGVDIIANELRKVVTVPLRQPEWFESYGLEAPRGVLMHGPPGSGKTRLACAAAAEAGATLMVVNGPELMTAVLGESEAGVRAIYVAARALAPTVVFIDEVDAFAPARSGMAATGGGDASDTAARVLATLLIEMQGGPSGSTSASAPVVTVGATNRPEVLDMALRRPGRFDREIDVGVPGARARASILKHCLTRIAHDVPEADIDALAGDMHGFVAADVDALAQEAAMQTLREYVARKTAAEAEGHEVGADDLCVHLAQLKHAAAVIKPSALREVAIEIPKVTWADVGGLDELKQQLKDIAADVKVDPEMADEARLLQPRGLLLYGAPGCSKTLLARAFAAEGGLNFIAVRCTDIFSKYVGESEKAVAKTFSRARQAAPAVVFFDEIDGLMRTRSEGGNGLYERILGQMLAEMDTVRRQQAQVVVLAATNRPGDLDSALLRPGRFDRLIYVPVPDEETRAGILKAQLRSMAPGHDVDVVSLAARTPGFTGADLAALCQAAAMCAMEESFDIEAIFMRHFEQALATAKASPPVDEETMQTYLRFRRGRGN
eukprot:jgi/Ulvmu1/11593/UM079_0037.1